MEINQTGIGKAAFEEVFKTHFRALHAYACTLLRIEAQAEELVQQVFYKLWLKKDEVYIRQTLQAYLYQSVYNECMNYLKHQKVRKAHQVHTLHTSSEEQAPDQRMANQELKEKIYEALGRLPEQCRTIFQMSRFEELKYREIAAQLNLSIKTVENQMGKALKLMRQQLADYLPGFWIILLLTVYW